jgi:hypothetical protein
MGPWDIMSEHFVRRQEPPPGISSFTKIRLNWISPDQVVTVLPGETSMAFLSPLARGGKTLAVKIPLPDGNYYLVENRQPVGYDAILPDAGIIILRVFPRAQEGYGTVELMNADPTAAHFSRAAYGLERGRGAFFVDRKGGFAVVPVWKEGDATGVVITAPQDAEEAMKAARAIDELQKTLSQPPAQGPASSLADAKAAFGRGDFKVGREIALKALQR